MPVANDSPPFPPQDAVGASASPPRCFSCTEPTSTQALAGLESGVWCLSVSGCAGEGGTVLLPSPWSLLIGSANSSRDVLCVKDVRLREQVMVTNPLVFRK